MVTPISQNCSIFLLLILTEPPFILSFMQGKEMWQIVAGPRSGIKIAIQRVIDEKKTGPRLRFHPGPFIKEKQAEVPSGRLAINFD